MNVCQAQVMLLDGLGHCLASARRVHQRNRPTYDVDCLARPILAIQRVAQLGEQSRIEEVARLSEAVANGDGTSNGGSALVRMTELIFQLSAGEEARCLDTRIGMSAQQRVGVQQPLISFLVLALATEFIAEVT